MNRENLITYYKNVRSATEFICAPLETEDYVVQPMADVSPPKWHLAHTAWFFETLVLTPFSSNYKPFHEKYGFLFNSYYHSFGERWDRPRRGVLSRPTVKDIHNYRAYTDEHMLTLLLDLAEDKWEQFWPIVVLGLNHEQQHQELMMMDIKFIFASNPLLPAYKAPELYEPISAKFPVEYININGGVYEIGNDSTGFSYDNESPRHKVYVDDFSVRNQLITNGDYLEFIQDGGYDTSTLWLADGWAARQQNNWRSPEHWLERDGEWYELTLYGPQKINRDAPVCHVSFYEAEAFASWMGERLLTEQEWEMAASMHANDVKDGTFWDSHNYHPRPSQSESATIHQMLGDVWEWTSSAYLPYPGYVQQEGALGEYNGKFMINQMVLRGGCCVTPRDHIRLSYRNFYQPEKRWPFTGIRLAR